MLDIETAIEKSRSQRATLKTQLRDHVKATLVLQTKIDGLS